MEMRRNQEPKKNQKQLEQIGVNGNEKKLGAKEKLEAIRTKKNQKRLRVKIRGQRKIRSK